MANRANDGSAPVYRVQDPVGPDASRMEALQAPDQTLPGLLWLELDQDERLEDGVAHRARQCFELLPGSSREPKLTQARARVSRRRG